MSSDKVLATIKEQDVKFVDFRFTDTRGKEQHVTVAKCSMALPLLAGKASTNPT